MSQPELQVSKHSSVAWQASERPHQKNFKRRSEESLALTMENTLSPPDVRLNSSEYCTEASLP